MNTFDLFILIPIALGLIFGLFKGFVKEVVSLAAVVLAIIAGAMMWPFKYFLNDLFSAKSFVSFVEEWSWNDLFSACGDFFWQKRTLRGGIGMFFLGFFLWHFTFFFWKIYGKY